MLDNSETSELLGILLEDAVGCDLTDIGAITCSSVY
jgi:hypothetical protein